MKNSIVPETQFYIWDDLASKAVLDFTDPVKRAEFIKTLDTSDPISRLKLMALLYLRLTQFDSSHLK